MIEPLGYVRAVERARELRLQDPTAFTWRAIAAVMAEYHGFVRGPGWWQEQLRGRVPRFPRGEAYGGDRAAA